MQDAKSKEKRNRKERRQDYDRTAWYEESWQEEADYIAIESELRGISTALFELGLDSIDDSGDEVGDSLYPLTATN